MGVWPMSASRPAGIHPSGTTTPDIERLKTYSGFNLSLASQLRALRAVRQLVGNCHTCRVCRLLRAAAQRYTEHLAAFLNEPPNRDLYGQSQGVCLRHLPPLTAMSGRDEVVPFQLSHAARRFEEIAEDMPAIPAHDLRALCDHGSG
jgi:hypothetical protein